MPVRFSLSPIFAAVLSTAFVVADLPVVRAQDTQPDIAAPAPAPDAAASIPRKKRRRPAVAATETSDGEHTDDLAGRYAVLREKRDTGCMVTLDAARIKGGERAQLAPGCRDQGIVIFDPTAWQLVKGELVLTARAGHKTHLSKDRLGVWQKDEKDGGKPLGLKRL